jgi:hypothetical protein
LDRSDKLVGSVIFLAQNHSVNYTSIFTNIQLSKFCSQNPLKFGDCVADRCLHVIECAGLRQNKRATNSVGNLLIMHDFRNKRITQYDWLISDPIKRLIFWTDALELIQYKLL